jgi:hypothetical protein
LRTLRDLRKFFLVDGRGCEASFGIDGRDSESFAVFERQA